MDVFYIIIYLNMPAAIPLSGGYMPINLLLQHSNSLTLITPQNMHMRPPMRPFKYACHQNIAQIQGSTADGAVSFHVPVNTVSTAAYMHHAVFAAVEGRKSQGFYEVAADQLAGTNRADLGIIRVRRFSALQQGTVFLFFTDFSPLTEKNIETEP
jgi:hypothetical protein